MTAIPHRPEFTLTGWHVLAIVVAFFAVVIGVDAAFTVMAIRTNPGAVSVTPYEDGLLYNNRIARLEAQERLGWPAAAAAEPGLVIVELRARDGRPVPGLELTGKLERPATEAGRILLTFREVEPGRYAAPTGRIAGAWDLTADAHREGGVVFTAERRLSWR